MTSSRVKRVPPIGALNATARPAPPNAVCIILTSESGSRARRAASAPIAAPMCTVGPSRPNTSPDPMLNTPPTNFAGSKRMSGGRASPRKTASTCWMPLPAASGSHRTMRAARVAPAAAAAIGTSQPGPGSLCAQSTKSMRRSSAVCRHQRNAPPTKPMSDARDDRRNADVYRTAHGIVGLIGTCCRCGHRAGRVNPCGRRSSLPRRCTSNRSPSPPDSRGPSLADRCTPHRAAT